MSKKCKRGASCAANGEGASPLLMRVAGELYERVDFQTDTINGLRDDLRHVMGDRDRLARANDLLTQSAHGLNADRANLFAQIDALIEQRNAADRAGQAFAEKFGKSLAEIDDLKNALAAIYLIGSAALHGSADGHIEQIVTLAESFAPIDEKPEAAPAWEVEPRPLPPGFVAIDPAGLPARLAERIAARGPNAEGFVEVTADELPRSVFRMIFGLDRPEPAFGVEINCFGEGCSTECNDKGCARERAEAEDRAEEPACRDEACHPDGAEACQRRDCAHKRAEAAATHGETRFTEAELFMLEAAVQHGFHQVDEAGLYTASEGAIVKLVTAARKQGEMDLVKVMTPVATAAARAKVILRTTLDDKPEDLRKSSRKDVIERTIKLIDNALAGLTA